MSKLFVKSIKILIFADRIDVAMPLLSISDLTIGYGKKSVQSHLTLEVHSGEMICLLGQNGCGKSTLLRTLSGLLPALGGEVYVDGMALSEMSDKLRSQQLSVVLTDRLSSDRTTVRDTVAMGRYPYSSFLGGLSQEDEEVIALSLSQTEMTGKSDCYFNELSDGEKQRVLISKALAQQTPVVLLDEPTAHLDLPNRIKTLLLLRELSHHTGRSILISTHELDLALRTADVIWLMSADGGVEVGTPSSLIASGAFERAFDDPSFRFVNREGHLEISF